MCGLIAGPGAWGETSISAPAANAGRSPAIRPAVVQAAARRRFRRFICYAMVATANGAGCTRRSLMPHLISDEPRRTCQARCAAAPFAYSYRVGARRAGRPAAFAGRPRFSGEEGGHQRAGTADALAG